MTGQSQFGLGRDDLGGAVRFVEHDRAEARAVGSRRFWTAIRSSAIWPARDIADPTDNTRIFPISPSPQTFNNERTDFYNALCG